MSNVRRAAINLSWKETQRAQKEIRGQTYKSPNYESRTFERNWVIYTSVPEFLFCEVGADGGGRSHEMLRRTDHPGRASCPRRGTPLPEAHLDLVAALPRYAFVFLSGVPSNPDAFNGDDRRRPAISGREAVDSASQAVMAIRFS